MKKIFIVAISAMLICAMLIPVSAEDNTYDFNGIILPIPMEMQEEFLEKTPDEIGSYMYLIDFPYAQRYVFMCSSQKLTIYDGLILKNENEIQAEYVYVIYDYGNHQNYWGEEKTGVIEPTEHKLFEATIYNVVWDNFSKVCDGSTCPATDMNIDRICDDCGMKLRLVMPSTYPTLPEVNGNNIHSVVLSRDDGFFYIVLKSDTPYSVRGDIAANFLITVANEQKVDYVTYKCTDGKNWVQNNSGEAYSTTIGDHTATLLDSTFDWYKDGTLFFQVPLWKVMNNLTRGEMKLFNPTMGGILTTLTVCGVGCLVLLVVLKLFGKRSLIFRN